MTTKQLAAFDFDHTIVDDNSDTVAIGLIDKRTIPDSVKQLYTNDGWTAYMQSIFKLLHGNNFDQTALTNAINKIPPVHGVCDLIRELASSLNFDVIIISDSNSYFIESWLDKYELSRYICKVFTNPAKFVDGRLNLEMYHLQDSCKLSTKNLCKGQILEDFIKAQNDLGVSYNRVVYVGDGLNDVCPMLRLNENGLACVRTGYKCEQMIDLILKGKPVPKTGKMYNLIAKLCIWNDGYDILNSIRNDDQNKIPSNGSPLPE